MNPSVGQSGVARRLPIAAIVAIGLATQAIPAAIVLEGGQWERTAHAAPASPGEGVTGVATTGEATTGEATTRAATASEATADPVAELPARLSDTGLFAGAAGGELGEGLLAYDPQYPLWTDGAAKRRWIRLPAGTSIDARDPDHFVFPVGTKLWKEFAFDRPVETRFIELGADGRWRFASYVWNAAGTEAELAPARGVPHAATTADGVPFDIPGRADCLACHAAGPQSVLGFSALQLSSDRDPLAPHGRPLPEGALDLDEFVRRGLIRGLPREHLDAPPRIEARTPRERAVLGYLSANCGMCHSAQGELAGLGLDLGYPLAHGAGANEPGGAPAITTTLDRESRFRWPSDRRPLRISTTAPEASVLARRMASRQPLSRMPPLGTRLPDAAALELVDSWIREELVPAVCVGTTDHDLLARNP